MKPQKYKCYWYIANDSGEPHDTHGRLMYLTERSCQAAIDLINNIENKGKTNWRQAVICLPKPDDCQISAGMLRGYAADAATLPDFLDAVKFAFYSESMFETYSNVLKSI